jgi:hypothetical protein
MSAVKIIFKRSSILGKRPTGANLEPGELGLNTNSNDPGIFLEVNDGSVVKAGPTAYLPQAPTQTPSLGELWVDTDTKALSIGTASNNWQTVAAPFLGGSGGYTVFVAPEFPNATDSLANDGQTVPFITINRAILEVSKQIIQQTISGTSLGNNRYLIVLAPGRHCVVNGTGTPVNQFTVDYSSQFTAVTQAGLQEFNPSMGGLILPRGVSIIGLDLKKCEVHPSYVPKYTHPLFIPNYTQETDGPVYQNEPLSSVFRWSGNTYESQFTCLDKVESRTVIAVSADPLTGAAIFRSSRTHGLNYNDFVQVNYSNSADQSNATFTSGAYYVSPVNAFEFQVSALNWTSSQALPVLATSLPAYFLVPSTNELPKLVVENIYPYYVPADGVSFEKSNYSHHRLSVNKNASLDQLNEFYTKVQKAFPTFFGGQVNTQLASAPEYNIVADTAANYPVNTTSNSVDNSSPYQNTVNHRSNYGMANGDFDGDLVTGFKSVILNASTAVTLQRDPAAYEVYSSVDQIWLTLTASVLKGLPAGTTITGVPTNLQLQSLNETSIPNIRYYYETIKTTDLKSTGLADPDNDFRHFGFRLSGANSFVQAQSVYTIGAAIGVWATNGGQISLTGSTTNFGSVAFQAEGFAGITTLGGANQVGRGFLLSGIVRPLSLLEQEVTSDNQKRILSLGSRIVHVGVDPNDPSVQQIYLQKPFDPAGILPFSLNPGSALFTTDGICTFRGFFVTNGTFTCVRSESNPALNPFSPGGAILRLRLSDSSIPSGDPASLDIPYIRRYVDPRTDSEKSYAFYVQSTNPTSQAPQLGSVLRLNQTGQSLSNTLKRNYQFDPGQYGGISQVFTVDSVETEQYSASPNFNYKVGDSTQATNYVVYASLTDASAPWTQSTTVPTSTLAPFNTPQGSYTTFQYRNYYAAENNLWDALYYSTNFTPISGPTKASPNSAESPFVVSSVLQKQEVITDAWQGYVPDPYYDYYVNDIPAPYNAGLTYLRGSVVPYTEYPAQFQADIDDSSEDLGLIFKRLANPASTTISVANSTTAQSFVAMSTPYVANPTFGRPAVIQMELLAVQQVQNPKQGVTVLKLSNPSITAVEYVRVISLNSNVIQAIRNYYPEYSQGTLPAVWPKGTVVTSCISTGFPEPSVYDPDWSVTKSTMFRFYNLMGYSYNQISPYLEPQYFGNRLLLNTAIPFTPINGYANLTSAWPVEFNNPSIIVATNHTWQYPGYLDYSRGLPKYQVNEISRKLQFDYLSTTSWGGRLTVSGVNETGNLVFLGPIREAITGRFYSNESPVLNPADRLTYTSPTPIDFPSPVLVYSADDISGLFDGVTTVFELTRGGYPLPATQLSTSGAFVFLGGVSQLPNISYSIQLTSGGLPLPRIQFVEAPPEGASCDIRIVSSDDSQDSVEVLTLTTTPGFDGVVSSFVLSPADPAVSNLNSFVFLGGVEQNPFGLTQTSGAYNITATPTTSDLNFIGGSPLPGTTLNIRAILSGARYRNAGVSTVFVSSADDIAPLFDSTKTTFPLEIDGISLDPVKVNSQNMFVSLGGVMQIPIANAGDPLAGNAYTVQLNTISNILEITFATPPLSGSTCNIRVVTSDEFITCPLPASLGDTALQNGPGIEVNSNNQIINIDPGLIG